MVYLEDCGCSCCCRCGPSSAQSALYTTTFSVRREPTVYFSRVKLLLLSVLNDNGIHSMEQMEQLFFTSMHFTYTFISDVHRGP